MENDDEELINPFFDKYGNMKQSQEGNLPHWDQKGKLQFITFHLADSLPKMKRDDMIFERDLFLKNHPYPWSKQVEAEYKKIISRRVELLLDNGYGSCALRRPELAKIVKECIFYNDCKQYIVYDYVVMPNHVHAVILLLGDAEVGPIVKGWKGVSSRYINKILGRKGELWFAEYYDRLIRNEDHLKRTLSYIKQNLRHGGVLPRPGEEL